MIRCLSRWPLILAAAAVLSAVAVSRSHPAPGPVSHAHDRVVPLSTGPDPSGPQVIDERPGETNVRLKTLERQVQELYLRLQEVERTGEGVPKPHQELLARP